MSPDSAQDRYVKLGEEKYDCKFVPLLISFVFFFFFLWLLVQVLFSLVLLLLFVFDLVTRAGVVLAGLVALVLL